MSAASSSGKLNFEFGFGSPPAGARRDPEEPLRILVLADFSGPALRTAREPLGTRKVRAVDVDNLEDVCAGFGAGLSLPQGVLKFGSLDDFHPDQLLQRVAPLAELLAARRLLLAPATAAQGAKEIERLLGARPAAPEVAPVPGPAPAESAQDTLARLLGGTPKADGPTSKASGGMDIQAIVKGIVGTSGSAPPAPPGLTGLRSAVDLELSLRFRALLHQPEFQRLESSWRLLDWLVRRCPDEERVKFLALDATLEECAADPAGLHRCLRDQPPDLLAPNFSFGASPTDLATLGGLAKVCASLNAALLAAAHPQLAGCDSFGLHPDPDDWRFAAPAEVREAWQALRATPEAGHVGLALPRFLLRQPYGAASERIDSFDFEEVPDQSQHEAFLWASSGFLCAQVLAEAFAAGASDQGASAGGSVGELPVFRFKQEGESAMTPCAEAWLSDRAADAILKQGLIACLSVKGRDAVRVAGLQSVASPSSPLKGRWGGG